MAELKLIKTTKAKIKSIPIKEGQLIFCEDVYGIYWDASDSERKDYREITHLTSSERTDLLAPPNGFYFETDTYKFWFFNGNNWIEPFAVNPNTLQVTYEDINDLMGLQSGEMLSSALKKIKFAVNKLISHLKDFSNPHKVTKDQIGLSAVENKSSATIRSELTKENISNALGYAPSSKILYNKAIFLGDSSSHGWDNGYYSFVDIFAESGDFGEVVKLAQGGACLGPYEITTAGKGKSCIELIQANSEEFFDTDVVFIQYCLNDINALMQGKISFGTPNDTSETISIWGYIKKIFETLYELNKYLKIYFINLTGDSDLFGQLTELQGGTTAAEYAYWHRYWMLLLQMIKDNYGTQIINAFDDVNFNMDTISDYTIITGDGIHLNTAGYQNIYHKIKASLDTSSQSVYTPQPEDLIVNLSGSQGNYTLPENSYDLIRQANELGSRVYIYFPDVKIYVRLVEFNDYICGMQLSFTNNVPVMVRCNISPDNQIEVTIFPAVGVPSGGSDGYVLTKKSASDYDMEWTDPSDLELLTKGFGFKEIQW